jgi:hypothetical integral membrane protein (TIGR02206 family)
MNEALEYFFGAGTEPEFSNFTLAHFLPVLTAAALIYLIWHFRHRLRQSRHESAFRYVIAFALILSEMSYYWRLVGMPSLGPNPVDHLPITVCGWAVIFCSYMLVGKCQSLFDISYFWLFSGSIFALITPTVITYTGPTRFRYYQFWAEHTLGYVAIFYMIFVHKMRPTIRSAIKSYLALLSLAVVAYFANRLIGPGANYLFLASPEDTPSVLDILPPNFLLRTVIIVCAITLLFGLSYLPWYLKDKKVKAAVPCPQV